MDEGFAYAWVPKALVYCLGQLAIGIVVVRRLIARGSQADQPWTPDSRWLDRCALVVAVLLVVGLMLRLWAQTAAAFGASEAWLVENLRVVALESRWGAGWRLQVLAAAGLLGAALSIPVLRAIRVHRAARILFDLCAVSLVLVMPLLGHAAGSVERHVLHATHHLAAAAWLGTLMVITMARWFDAVRDRARADLAPLIGRFSPLALAAAPLVMMSGLVAASLYVGSWSSLWTTSYGRILAAKVAFVLVIAGCGAVNWRDVRRGRQPTLAVMTLESIAALAVLGLTGILTETGHP